MAALIRLHSLLLLLSFLCLGSTPSPALARRLNSIFGTSASVEIEPEQTHLNDNLDTFSSHTEIKQPGSASPLIHTAVKDHSLGTELGYIRDRLDQYQVKGPEGKKSKMDCQALLLERVKMVCDPAGGSGVGEAEKIGIAISLTLCSLTSALQVAPSECAGWNPICLSSGSIEPTSTPSRSGQCGDRRAGTKYYGGEEGENDGAGEGMGTFPGEGKMGDRARGKCLEALHRSPQDWSSYNAYFAQATQLCHALQGRQELDIARTTYVDATKEKIRLLGLLSRHEDQRRAAEEEFERGWREKLESLFDVATTYRSTQSSLDDIISSTHTSSTTLLAQLTNALAFQESEKMGLLRTLTEEGISVTRSLVEDAIGELMAKSEETSMRMAEGLGSTVDQHASSLNAVVSSIALIVKDSAHQAVERDLQLWTANRERMDKHSADWLALQLTVDSTSGALNKIAAVSDSIYPSLDRSLRLAEQLHNQQSQHSQDLASTVTLADHLNSLVRQSFAQAQSSVEMLERLKADLANDKWRSGWLSLWSGLWAFTSASLPASVLPFAVTLGQRPVVQAVLSVAGVGCTLLINAATVGLYMLTSIWLLFRTGIWRVARKLHREYLLILAAHQTDLEHAKPPPYQAAHRSQAYPASKVGRPLYAQRPQPFPSRTPINRRPSRGRQLDTLARRAQSEPPGF